MEKMSRSLEDYLEAILLLERESAEVRLTDIAARMKVAKPSVNNALHALSDRGFIVQALYKPITLTAQGRTAALAVYERHSALRQFFSKFLGVDEQTAEADACAVEHVLSEESMHSIIKLLEKQGGGE